MVQNDYNKKKIIEYENRFLSYIKENEIKVLRDIAFTREDFQDLRQVLRYLIKNNKFYIIKIRAPLTISIFIVWSAIYTYKDGDMWQGVSNELNIRNTSKNTSELGEVFLKTLKRNKLLELEDKGFKKYLSPILMHGYISDFYVEDIFDRMNKIYNSILDRDASRENINKNWDLIFPENTIDSSIKKEKEKLELKSLELENSLKEFNINFKDLELLDIDISSIEDDINNLEKDIQKYNLRNLSIQKDIEQFKDRLLTGQDILEKTIKIEGIDYKQELVDLRNYILKSFKEYNQEIDNIIINLESDYKKNKNLIQRQTNEYKIKNSKLLEYKTRVSIIGSGDLEKGWEELSEYKKLDKELNEIKDRTERLNRHLNYNPEDASFFQIYTASLYHLRASDEEIFRKFIIELIENMDRYFRTEELDEDWILAEQFINWYRNPKSDSRQEQILEQNQKSSKDIKLVGGKRKKYLKRLDKLREPILQLSNEKYRLKLIFPEQVLDLDRSIVVDPTCQVEYLDGSKENLELTSYRMPESVQIMEEKILVQKPVSSISFIWFNIREEFELNMESIMIFDQDGRHIKKTLLDNGLYYILVNDSWETEGRFYIDKIYSSVEGFSLIEVYLNESSIIFKNKDSGEKILVISSIYNSINLENYNLVRGITSNGLGIVNGALPSLVYNELIIDSKNLDLQIKKAGMEVYKKSLYKVDEGDTDSSLRIIDLNSLIGENFRHPIEYSIKITRGLKEIFSVDFLWVGNTDFKFVGNQLIFTNYKKSRVKNPKAIFDYNKVIIPLNDKKDDIVEIYYDGYGSIFYKIENPKLTFSIINGQNKPLNFESFLLKDDLERNKDGFILVKSNSSLVRNINISNKNGSLSSNLRLSRGEKKVSIDSFIDFLCLEDEDELYINWMGSGREGKPIKIFRIFKEWKISEMEVYHEETDDEFILEISYKENFPYRSEKKMSVFCEDKMIFERKIKEEDNFYYLKKEDLKSDKISIEVFRNRESGLFSSGKDIVFSMDYNLVSRMRILEEIKKKGIEVISFTYKEKLYKLNDPLIITNILEGEPLNFIGEKIYTGNLKSSSENKIMFYLDLDKMKLPLLLDLERDGAQYNTESGEVFWELRKGTQILAPVEDFNFKIGGE